MEPKVNYTIVGSFVVLLIIAIVMSILWLSAGITTTQHTLYQININESVAGLTVGAPVKYNGVEIGTVKNITLNSANPQEVEVLLNIKTGTPITEDTIASLDTQGITGIAYIALKNIGNNMRPLQALPGEPYPIIRTVPSLLVRLDTGLSKLTSNLNQVSNNIQTVLDSENQRSIKRILNNFDKLSASLVANTQQLPLLLQNSQNILNNLNHLTHNLTEISNEIKQNPTILIRGKTSAPLGPGEK